MRWIRRSTVVPLSTLAIAAAGVSFGPRGLPAAGLVCLGEEAVGPARAAWTTRSAPSTVPGTTRWPRADAVDGDG